MKHEKTALIVGILEADELDADVLQRYGRYAESFEKLLSPLDPRLEFQTYHVTREEYPDHLDDCDAYLLTGSKFSCYEDSHWIHRLKQFVMDCAAREKRRIGICLDHQFIAQALGGEVKQHDKGWGIDMASSDVTHAAEWLDPDRERFNLRVSHRDRVARLPREASLVATNAFCPVASYHVNHRILTFQGHPEFHRGYIEYLMDRDRDKIGEPAYRRATVSPQQPEDNEVVASIEKVRALLITRQWSMYR
jgi:GMP synthase-like glutamine amidotransferase